MAQIGAKNNYKQNKTNKKTNEERKRQSYEG